MTTKLLTKVSTGLATGGVLLALAVTSSFASTKITTKNNAANSINTVGVVNTTLFGTTQTNNTFNSNFVGTATNTGFNTSSFNNGGSNGVKTGSSNTKTTVTNISGLNLDASDPCGCGNGNTMITTIGNAAGSKNTTNVVNTTVHTVTQTNNTTNVNVVNTTTNTGGNTSMFNSNGNAGIVSGNSSSTTTVTNVSGANGIL